jgi:Na+/melibiose symporter-like transporter
MYNKDEILFLSENTFLNNIYFLVQGVFATAMCSYYGFSTLLSTVIIAFPILFVNLQLFSPLLFQWSNNKKRLLLTNNILSKLCFSLSFASVISPDYGAAIFIVFYIAGYTFFNFAIPTENQWLVNSLSEHSRLSYFALKDVLFLLTFSLFNLITGSFLKTGQQIQTGFIKFSLMLLIFTIISFISLINIKTDIDKNKNYLPLKKIFTIPFKHKRYSKLLVLLGLYNFSLWFTGSFSNVYIIQIIKLDINAIVLINAAGLLLRTIIIPLFNKTANSKGWKNIIFIGFLSMAVSHILWNLMSGNNATLIYTFIVMLQNFAYGSLGTGIYVAQILNMPTANKNMYFAAGGFVTGISGTLSALISVAFVSLLVPDGINIFGINIPYQIIFFGLNSLLFFVTALYFTIKINIMKIDVYNLALKTESELLLKKYSLGFTKKI